MSLSLAPIQAATAPPAEAALKPSQIVAQPEASVAAEFAWIGEVEWDDDGCWEVEYYTTVGARVEIRIDSTTGAQRAGNLPGPGTALPR